MTVCVWGPRPFPGPGPAATTFATESTQPSYACNDGGSCGGGPRRNPAHRLFIFGIAVNASYLSIQVPATLAPGRGARGAASSYSSGAADSFHLHSRPTGTGAAERHKDKPRPQKVHVFARRTLFLPTPSPPFAHMPAPCLFSTCPVLQFSLSAPLLIVVVVVRAFLASRGSAHLH